MIEEKLSIRQIGERLADAVNIKTNPICIYGSDQKPEDSIHSSQISTCLAQSMYLMAEGNI